MSVTTDGTHMTSLKDSAYSSAIKSRGSGGGHNTNNQDIEKKVDLITSIK